VRDHAGAPDEAEIGRTFREESGRSVAALIRAFGDIDVAEDAVQEAFAVALSEWPSNGLPPNPGGWMPICCGGWAGATKPRRPTSVPRNWRPRPPSVTFLRSGGRASR
jgi:predicted RNA polymerase sigma factor